VVTRHPHALAVGQWPHPRAVLLRQPAAEPVRRPAPYREAHPGQPNLGVDHLLGQVTAVLARLLVIHERGDQFADVASLARLDRRHDAVGEHQGDAIVAEEALQLQRIHRVVGARQSVAARDEDVRDGRIR
jgi:hypothetical protein